VLHFFLDGIVHGQSGIASSMSLKQNSDDYDCNHDDEIALVPQKVAGRRKSAQYSTTPLAADFEENVRLVISMQMNGCRGEDAAAVLDMMNLPSGARMRHTHFMAIEEEIGQVEIDVAEQAIRDGLEEEIKRTVEATMDLSYEQWWLALDDRPRIGLIVL
jgi:hypothetical protein